MRRVKGLKEFSVSESLEYGFAANQGRPEPIVVKPCHRYQLLTKVGRMYSPDVTGVGGEPLGHLTYISCDHTVKHDRSASNTSH